MYGYRLSKVSCFMSPLEVAKMIPLAIPLGMAGAVGGNLLSRKYTPREVIDNKTGERRGASKLENNLYNAGGTYLGYRAGRTAASLINAARMVNQLKNNQLNVNQFKTLPGIM